MTQRQIAQLLAYLLVAAFAAFAVVRVGEEAQDRRAAIIQASEQAVIVSCNRDNQTRAAVRAIIRDFEKNPPPGGHGAERPQVFDLAYERLRAINCQDIVDQLNFDAGR